MDFSPFAFARSTGDQIFSHSPSLAGQGGPHSAIDAHGYLYHIGDMEKTEAMAALGALAQETRLDIYRLLVQAGPDGLPAGQIGERLGLPSATLAFHLKELKNAKLARCTRNGRSLIYAAEYPVMNALLFFLTENCCGRGAIDCLPICPPDKTRTSTPVKRRR